MLSVPPDNWCDHGAGDKRGYVWRGMLQPMPLFRRNHYERRQSAGGQNGAVLRQPRQTQTNADKEPEPPSEGLIQRVSERTRAPPPMPL